MPDPDPREDLQKFKNPTTLVWELSNEILEYFNLITFRDTEDCYCYNGSGIYENNGEQIIKEQVIAKIRARAKRDIINEVINTTKIRTFVKRDAQQIDPAVICVKNGFIDLSTGNFQPHTPELWFFSKLPVRYDPTAMCPAIDKFFQEIFQPDDLKIIEELIGYCLLRSYKYHKAVMLYGEGGTGKTTFLNLLHAFFGEDNIANVSLQSLVYLRFTAIELHNKLVNIYDDLSDIPLKITGKFKMATGESKIFADRKHKDPITFYNHAKLIFACNKLPDTDDVDYAFFRRWIVIQFKNNFYKNGIADENKLQELITPQELSGLLNKAIFGLQRLLKNHGFSQSNSIDDIMNFWLREANTVSAFTEAWLEVDADPNSIISKDDMYAAYCDYCRLNDCVPKTKPTLGDNLIKLLGSKIRTKRAGTDKRKYVWTGVKFKQ